MLGLLTLDAVALDGLAIYLEEEFSVTLEDQSERQVAEALFRMYEECFRGDFTYTRNITSHANGAVQFSAQHQQPVQTTEHDDDDDDEMLGQGDSHTLEGQAGDAPQSAGLLQMPLFGEAKKPRAETGPVRQLGETVPEGPQDIEMDDDGFAPIKQKGRRKR